MEETVANMMKMTKTYKMDTNSIIPEEILFEILTMLPVKSLCRFKCVSKYWFSIFSDPNFIDAHLSRSKLRPKLLISLTKEKNILESSREKITRFYSIEYPEEHHESSSILHATSHGAIPYSPYDGVISVSSASDLISCNCYQGINIGNPITGKFNLIHYLESSERNYATCYLGFDPIDKRQVILRLENGDHVKSSSVFTLGQWHNTTLPQPFIFVPNKSSVCVNGVIYFFAWVYNRNSIPNVCRFLYAFDVRSECFEVIQHNCTDNVELLIEYKGCVALVCSGYYAYNRPHTNEMKLWILNDPKKHSWSSKSFVVLGRDNFLKWNLELFGVTHRGELIFATQLSKGYFDLLLYKIDTSILRRFRVYGLDCCPTSKARLNFLTESLNSSK